MNRKGFTLVELLATIIVLAIVVGITVPSVSGIIRKSKEKSEEAFVETIKDAMDVYLSSSGKNLHYYPCDSAVYKYSDISFQDVIDSPYKPIKKGEFFNPANGKRCNADTQMFGEGQIIVYRTNNYVYYYVIKKEDLECFEHTLDDEPYISNIENPEIPLCNLD